MVCWLPSVNISSAIFDCSAPELDSCPDESLPEFAFVGRSNVGKSSLLKEGREELLGVIDESMTAIQAESGQAQPDAMTPPEDLATTSQRVSPRVARKRRPDLVRPW
jgi:hypothetical protein